MPRATEPDGDGVVAVGALRVDRIRLREDLEALARFGRNDLGGIDRPSFSPADTQARAWLVERSRDAGLATREDGIGNLYIRLDAAADHAGTSPVWAGSHIDAVPNGGRFDGAVGVLAAVEVLRRLQEERVRLTRPVEAVVWSDEEGCYQSLLGSGTLVDGLSEVQLDRIVGRDGRTLRNALAGSGRDAESAVRTGKHRDVPAYYLELHIEQGVELERNGADIGVVTGIVGLAHGEAHFHGRADHAGTTPMDARQDALRAAAAFVLRIAELPGEIGRPNAVATCGNVHVSPGADNIVPSDAVCRLDVRDADQAGLADLQAAVIAAARQCATDADVTAQIRWNHQTDPVAMDDGLQQLIGHVSTGLGHKQLALPSRAAHDAQNVAVLAPAGMIFVPSLEGRSHCPEEYTDPDQVARGADVLLGVVAERATDAATG